MRQRIVSVSLCFIVGAVYLLQWHALMPELNNAAIQDYFRYPIILAALLGYLFCKHEKQRWQYSLLLATADLLLMSVKLFVLRTPFILPEMILLPVVMVVFYKYYFDWLLSIEIQFAELQHNIQEHTIADEDLIKQYMNFQEQRKETMNQFNIRYFLNQEKTLLMMQESLVQLKRKE